MFFINRYVYLFQTKIIWRVKKNAKINEIINKIFKLILHIYICVYYKFITETNKYTEKNKIVGDNLVVISFVKNIFIICIQIVDNQYFLHTLITN